MHPGYERTQAIGGGDGAQCGVHCRKIESGTTLA